MEEVKDGNVGERRQARWMAMATMIFTITIGAGIQLGQSL